MPRAVSPLPSVAEVLSSSSGREAVARHGQTAATKAARGVLQGFRVHVSKPDFQPVSVLEAAERTLKALEQTRQPKLRRVFNLTGTVLHTNLGRAILAERTIAAVADAMRYPAALEFDLETGARGERDDGVRDLLCEITGAESACIVNNNAAAVLLVLNTFGKGKQTVVSRGELIEIGGAFRMPDIMARAGTKLVEVGTTNRTHLRDYKEAISDKTGLLLKVHTSNYMIQGFTRDVPAAELAKLAREAGVPFADDLGSGTLADVTQFGLKKERTVQDALNDGADLVTFSGDKLLGGPQAGIIAGRKDLVAACAKNPMKRALRLDKLRLAALEATLQLYLHPETLASELPTFAFFSRPQADIEAQARRLVPKLAAALGAEWKVDAGPCKSQVGSGALPLESLPSFGLFMSPRGRKETGRNLAALAAAFRRLPVPVIGHVAKDSFVLDLRCLDDEETFAGQLRMLSGLNA